MPTTNHFKTDSNAKRVILVFLCLLIVAILAVGLTRVAIDRIQSSVRAEYGASLNAVIDTTEAALTFWSEQRKSELLRLSENEVVQAIANQLNETFDNRDLAGLETLRESALAYISSLNALQIDAQYHLISREGFYLYSNKQNLNSQMSPIKLHYPRLFEAALSGQASFIPPINIKVDPNTYQAFAYFIAPIMFEEKVIGLIASSHKPEEEMSKIMSLGRIGKSGQSYMVNQEGQLVTQSRFKNQLLKLDKIGINESEVLKVSLTVPSINSENTNQLTLMASSVTQFESAQNLDGYFDYRGVEVIGTWKWLPELQLGMATEIDYAEANEPFIEAKYTIIGLVAVNISVVLCMAIILYLISTKANKKLRKAANELEETVAKRTQDLRNTAKQLTSEKTTIQGVLDNIPDPIFCKDAEGRYVRINQAFADLTGYTQSAIVGKNDFELYEKSEAEFFTQDDEKTLIAGESHILESSATDVVGKKRLFETRKALIHYNSEDKAGILGISRDITDRKRIEEAMLNATRSAQEANNAKSDFLALVSHEIRTPMNGILGMIDLLLDSNLNIDQTHKLKVAKNSASSLLTIINDILDFSRIEAGKLSLESLDFNLNHQIESITQTLAMLSDAKGLELIVDCTEIEQNMVIGDPTRLRQILTNLVTNAIKFTESGQILVKAKAKLVGELTFLECYVEDTGIGIPKNHMARLFDSFSQVDTSTTRIYGGSGLGLAICKKLIELMGGRISATSVLNKGSCFTFSVELKTSNLESKSLPHLNIHNWHVLVVDDNATNREVLENQLSNWGARVTLAVDAADALKKLKDARLQLDLIITDMNMPNKDGLALAADIKQIKFYRSAKILMLSSTTFHMSETELHSAGLDACLMKPVGVSELFNTLSELSSGAHMATQNQVASNDNTQTLDDVKWPVYHKVLVVEDNPINQLVAEGMLTKFGLRYDIVINGKIALEILKESANDQPYTLILMDCQMPILDGYKTTEKIRQGDAGERYAHIPIIAMTANAMKGDKEKCLKYGMNDYVPKPVSSRTLQEALISGFLLTPKHLLRFKNHALPKQTEDASDSITLPKGLLTMDSTSLPHNFLNQANIYLKCLHLFKKQYGDLFLSYPNTRSEMDSLKDRLHKVKGSSGNIGLVQLHQLSASIENKLFENKLLNSDLERFSIVLSEAIQDIDRIVEANAKPISLGDDKRSVAVILKEIQPFVDRSELVPFKLVDELSIIARDCIEDTTLYAIITALEGFDYETSKKLIEGKL